MLDPEEVRVWNGEPLLGDFRGKTRVPGRVGERDIVGVRRQFVYRNGRYYDSVMMSVLRDEYRARNKT